MLRQDECLLPSGRVIDDFFVVEVPDGAAIVAITDDNELLLIKQYKHGFGDFVLELPAGIVEQNEDPALTIARELREETGFVATNIEFVTTLITKPARMSARTQIYFANGGRFEYDPEFNDAEVIEKILVPVAELPALIAKGNIMVETSLAALLMVWDKLVK
ncbi:NUDIX hydrolase [Spirosoma sordidisoli]|nr:NUDIX hydrolase [Spirosoma sordidisoli]